MAESQSQQNNNFQLSTEQEFEIIKFNSQIQKANLEQAKALAIEAHTLLVHQQAAIRTLLRQDFPNYSHSQIKRDWDSHQEE